ncbi:MAG: Tungsten-containing formylmethanofuran dehydrogenase 2 subunit C [Candidatus Bathyarchaeota archaeon BA1]|nr:MAG: Tungsten-containing formylmethanofuran dehydrogenase 2 subunit C [Candidatus Bathyarchaeota archaeon BA1]
MITIYPKRPFKALIEAKCITPDAFVKKSVGEIVELPVWEGNSERTLGNLFKIVQEPETSEEATIRISGDAGKVRGIGAGMSMGKIIVDGDVGMHLGGEMGGGTITIIGNAGSWAGSMMKNGTIEVMGDAGDYAGAAYRGSTQGMRGGTIIIHGNAGNEVGCFMRKGLIKIYGNAGQFVGIHMRNGTIFVKGNSEGRAGAQILGGKIVICGYIPSILPTFTVDSVRSKVKINGEEVTGPFYMFAGDLAEGGDGKLYVSKAQNPHLNLYEKYL